MKEFAALILLVLTITGGLFWLNILSRFGFYLWDCIYEWAHIAYKYHDSQAKLAQARYELESLRKTLAAMTPEEEPV